MVARTTKAEEPGENAPVPANMLASKLAAIILDIGHQSKGARNKEQKYDYYSAEAVYGWWRDRLAQNQIIVFPSLVDTSRPPVPFTGEYRSGGKHFVTEVAYKFTFLDGQTGESITMGPVLGQGDDTSDKGSGKAITYAFKMLLLTMGMNAGPDLDNEAYDEPTEVMRTSGKPKIEDSNVEMSGRGGKGAKANEAQIKRIRTLFGQKGLAFSDMAVLANELFGAEILGDTSDAEKAGKELREFIAGRSAEEAGRLADAMDEFEDVVQQEAEEATE